MLQSLYNKPKRSLLWFKPAKLEHYFQQISSLIELTGMISLILKCPAKIRLSLFLLMVAKTMSIINRIY
jgi:hypothetical protein